MHLSDAGSTALFQLKQCYSCSEARYSFSAAMDCDRINETLLVGSCLLDSKDFEDLRSLGVTAILSLQTENDMGERGIEWEEKAALNAKLAFRSLPVRDFDTQDLRRKLPECWLCLITC